MLYAKQPKQLPNAENTMINNLIEILRKQWGYEESIEDCWAPFCIERGFAFSGGNPHSPPKRAHVSTRLSNKLWPHSHNRNFVWRPHTHIDAKIQIHPKPDSDTNMASSSWSSAFFMVFVQVKHVFPSPYK